MSLLSTLQSVGTVNQKINKQATKLETFVDNGNNVFNAHINELASKLEQNAEQHDAMLQKLVTCQHALNEDIKDALKNTLEQGADAFNAISGSVGAIIVDLENGANPQTISAAAGDFNHGWDKSIESVTTFVTGEASDKFIEGWTRTHIGDKLFDCCGALKRGASTAIEGVGEYMALKDTFGGSWRDPEVAAKKITSGVTQAISATQKVSTVLSDMAKAMGGTGELFGLHDIQKNAFGQSAVGLSHVAAGGILTAPFVGGVISAVKAGNLKGAVEIGKTAVTGVQQMIDGVKDTTNAIKKSPFLHRNDEDEKDKNNDPKEKKHKDRGESENEKNTDEEQKKLREKDKQVERNSTKDTISPTSPGSYSTSQTDDDYSADLISEVSVMIDGGSSGLVSSCTINGTKYRLSGYTISQELLQPMMLSLSIEKEDKLETQQDVIFADATQLIGKSLEVIASTIKTSKPDGSVPHPRTLVFKGMIIDVSASRATASAQSASITAATWDSLLHNAPHCRSFENMTLKDIVSKVLEPFKEVASSVSPRFADKIPYIVQYNQSDYAFVRMLACRFGEWMYSTGEKFVFGEMENSSSDCAKLEYPGGSLMSYNLNQNLNPFSFTHLLSDHYKYGSGEENKKKEASNVADGKINDWTDRAYQASKQRYNHEHIVTLASGGFDNSKDEEGAESILEYSAKIEAQGAKTGIMTVSGSSKLAMLKIGQSFLICDNVQNRSGESLDVQQKVLKIIGINHTFDYSQEYSNTFTAVPNSCKYPAYSDSNLHAIAPTQRAKVVDNKDEQKLGRIRVQFPWQEMQSQDMKTPWLRMAVPYAGKEKGHLFVPEIDEEVMVGFEMDNAERPYIIGALYNGGEGKPDEKWASSESEDGTTNNIKAIRSRNGHTILYNDKGDAGLLEIYDNKNNTYHITLSADDKKITIYSAGDIEINADGSISMTAKKDVSIKADSDVSIKADSNVTVKADKEVSIQASKVKVR